ncbi:RAD51-associated protein 1 isoform X1 [Lepisosteus oculatus]|uniref:RAD51-associated protein 1 isoform X1 n=1 Tax=Lepisosteus oculatus TaxID=7918 RepID=UPI003713DF72
MARPSRTKKPVDYSQFGDLDDDDDFACVKAPPSKKPRGATTEQERERTPKAPARVSNEGSGSQPEHGNERLSVHDKVYNRDLEAALVLSMLQSAEEPCEALSPEAKGNGSHPEGESENMNGPPLLSNCSVDINLLGLDKITDEKSSTSGPRQRRAASKATERQKKILMDDEGSDAEADEEYLPTCTPVSDGGSESDADFSNEEENDEEFAVRKNVPKKPNKKEKKGQPQSSKKEKKPSKSKPRATVTPSSGTPSPTAARPSPVPKKMVPSTPPLTASKSSVSGSPGGGRIPKWTPPGQIGKSPEVPKSLPARSPGQGLRLGLSRLARVKPLHPSAAVN